LFLVLVQSANYSPTQDEFYKSAKLGANEDVKSKGKAPAVEDEEEESEFAGPELPPDFEEDVPDDEDGRFFGGGVARETAQAMEYLDEQDQDQGEVAVSSEPGIDCEDEYGD
jgi:beta-catenin-like protein 1